MEDTSRNRAESRHVLAQYHNASRPSSPIRVGHFAPLRSAPAFSPCHRPATCGESRQAPNHADAARRRCRRTPRPQRCPPGAAPPQAHHGTPACGAAAKPRRATAVGGPLAAGPPCRRIARSRVAQGTARMAPLTSVLLRGCASLATSRPASHLRGRGPRSCGKGHGLHDQAGLP